MPLNDFEHQLYTLLLEIKQSQASLCTDIATMKDNSKLLHNSIAQVENMAKNNECEIGHLKIMLRAWISAAAVIGGFVGWVLSTFKEIWIK